MPGSLAVRLAAAHGRATTRAVHPVISRTVSRAAVADRLRMGFDKSPPAPLLALVAALAKQGRSSSTARIPLAVHAAPGQAKPKRFRLPPIPHCEVARRLGRLSKNPSEGSTEQKASR